MLAVTVDEVQHLIEQDQDGGVGGLEYSAQRFGPGRSRLSLGSEFLYALVSGQLSSNVNPRGFSSLLGIPSVSDKDGDSGLRRLAQAGVTQQLGHPVVRSNLLASGHQVIERRQRVRLASAKLGHKRHDRRGIRRLASQTPKHHPRVLLQRPREACP